jgi:hypothetical protein
MADNNNYQGPGRYRHYKGSEYEVLGLGIHEHAKDNEPGFSPHDPQQLYVIYKPLTPGGLLDHSLSDFWIRGLSDFNDFVNHPLIHPSHQLVPRFEKISDA